MNFLYKYCDQLGIVKILGSLELKLPYISDVNDPYECSPFFDCPDDKAKMKEQGLQTFKRNNIEPPADWEQKSDELIENGKIQKQLEEGLRKELASLNQKSCLLSVSKTAQEPVMWAHYAEGHKGAAIGIDFDNIHHVKMKINPVTYPKNRLRPRINILDDFYSEEFLKKYGNILLTKSVAWSYEGEFRAMFDDATLMNLEQKGLMCLRDFKGKKTWFLRLNPESIIEVVFGLYTEESLKSAIRKLIERPELQHVKLRQAEESETYTLDIPLI